MKKYIVYAIKIDIGDVKGAIWKIGRANSSTLNNRAKYVEKTIKVDADVDYQVFSIVSKRGVRWREIALQQAFKRTLAPIKSHKASFTEFYASHVLDDRKVVYHNITEYEIERVMDELTTTPMYGDPELFGNYLASILSSNVYFYGDQHPAYCKRFGGHISVDYPMPVTKYDPYLDIVPPATQGDIDKFNDDLEDF